MVTGASESEPLSILIWLGRSLARKVGRGGGRSSADMADMRETLLSDVTRCDNPSIFLYAKMYVIAMTLER